ncbi:hypothetical protein AB9N12_02440 [Bacteroides sp. AN502(2024)]|uniref:hypothetical protein n=1 Tax=Bacteroides sp. AN502(2024) TaxID=3160599 RepID=UPI003512FD39
MQNNINLCLILYGRMFFFGRRRKKADALQFIRLMQEQKGSYERFEKLLFDKAALYEYTVGGLPVIMECIIPYHIQCMGVEVDYMCTDLSSWTHNGLLYFIFTTVFIQ